MWPFQGRDVTPVGRGTPARNVRARRVGLRAGPVLRRSHPIVAGRISSSASARKRRNAWSSVEEAYAAYSSKPPLQVMTAASLRAYVEYGLRDRGDGVFELNVDPRSSRVSSPWRRPTARGLSSRICNRRSWLRAVKRRPISGRRSHDASRTVSRTDSSTSGPDAVISVPNKTSTGALRRSSVSPTPNSSLSHERALRPGAVNAARTTGRRRRGWPYGTRTDVGVDVADLGGRCCAVWCAETGRAERPNRQAACRVAITAAQRAGSARYGA